jgi:hypothetical protein
MRQSFSFHILFLTFVTVSLGTDYYVASTENARDDNPGTLDSEVNAFFFSVWETKTKHFLLDLRRVRTKNKTGEKTIH